MDMGGGGSGFGGGKYGAPPMRNSGFGMGLQRPPGSGFGGFQPSPNYGQNGRGTFSIDNFPGEMSTPDGMPTRMPPQIGDPGGLSGGNPQWLQAAMAPNGNVPWDFSQSILGQRGLVQGPNGQLVPKATVQGAPVHAYNNPNRMPTGMAGGQGYKGEAGGQAWSPPNGLAPNTDWYRNYPEGQAFAQQQIGQIQNRLANPGTYDPANPFGGGLSPQAMQQLREQLGTYQSYQNPFPTR